MPRWIAPALLILGTAALVPFACVARARVTHSSVPRLHLVMDMDNQPRFESQQANGWFADGRAMRAPVAGTVPRGAAELVDAHYAAGLVGGAYAAEFPAQVRLDLPLLRRGQQRYDIYCAPCHGLAGYGDGMVARRAERLQAGWTPPASLHVEPAASRAPGHLFNTISNGIRTMPAYGAQIELGDRWAIVAYIKALQRSQHARIEDVPAELRNTLRQQ